MPGCRVARGFERAPDLTEDAFESLLAEIRLEFRHLLEVPAWPDA